MYRFHQYLCRGGRADQLDRSSAGLVQQNVVAGTVTGDTTTSFPRLQSALPLPPIIKISIIPAGFFFHDQTFRFVGLEASLVFRSLWISTTLSTHSVRRTMNICIRTATVNARPCTYIVNRTTVVEVLHIPGSLATRARFARHDPTRRYQRNAIETRN